MMNKSSNQWNQVKYLDLMIKTFSSDFDNANTGHGSLRSSCHRNHHSLRVIGVEQGETSPPTQTLRRTPHTSAISQTFPQPCPAQFSPSADLTLSICPLPPPASLPPPHPIQ